MKHALLSLVLVSGTLSAQSYTKLSGPLPTSSSVLESWRLTPDGARAVFLRLDDSGARGVFSAPLDGASEVALSASLVGTPQGFALGPDGSRVVVHTRSGSSSTRVDRLYSVPIGGGTRALLFEGALQVLIHSFQIAPSGSRVVYHAGLLSGPRELWSVPLDGSMPPVRLNEPLPPGRTVLDAFRISHGGLRTFYVADQDADDVYDLYSVPTDRSQPPVRLNTTQPWADVTSFALAFDSLSVVYRSDQDTDETFELYVTSTLGGFTPVRRSGPLVAGGDVTSFQLAAASQRLVFLADAEEDERFELYALDPTAPGARVKLSGSLASDRDVLDARVSADGLRVVYRSDEDTDGQAELHGVPATGGTPVRLNGPLAAGESILSDYALEDASGHVLFHRDMVAPMTYDARQLYSAPLDGSQPARRLNGELVERGNATLLEARSDGVLFRATEVADEVELFRASLAGDDAPLQLSTGLPAGWIVAAARFTASGAVVFEAGEELFAVPGDGGARTRIAGSRVEGTRPLGVIPDVAATREHALFVGIQAPALAQEVFSVRLDGSEPPCRLGRGTTIFAEDTLVLSRDGTHAVYRLSAHGLDQLCSVRVGVPDSEVVLAADGLAFDGNEESVTDFALTPDGDSVVFAVSSAASLSVRRTRLDGSEPAEELASWPDATARLHLSPDGNRLVLAGAAGLHSLPADGQGPPLRLDSGETTFPHVRFTPDSSRVLFAASGTGSGLFSARLDGAQPTAQLGAGTILAVEFAHDGTSVLFLEGAQPGQRSLYRAPLDGGGPTSLLASGYLQYFQQDPLSGLVVFYDSFSDTLFSVPTLGGSAPTTLAHVFAAPMAGSPLRFSGPRVTYLAWEIECGGYNSVERLYSVPVGGGEAPRRLDLGSCSEGVALNVEPVDFARGLLFVLWPGLGEEIGLYGVPADRSTLASRIAGPRWLDTYPRAIEQTPDGSFLLCRTNAEASSSPYQGFDLHVLRLTPRTRRSR